MSNPIMSIFEFEILFEKEEDEWHYFKVVAKDSKEASKIVDKHDFGFGDVSWTEKHKWSVCKKDKLIGPTTEPRILNYSFLGTNKEESDEQGNG
jgi:hypothetical protein